MDAVADGRPDGVLDKTRLAAAAQQDRDFCALYIARHSSKRLTPLFLKSGLSANQATAVWGGISLANTGLVYWAMRGYLWLAPVIFAIFVLVLVIDCVDGEIARYRGTSSPIGGKLLDGAWHKATEFGQLVAYATATFALTGSPWVFPISLLLLSGEAIYTFVYERRLTVIRVHAKSTEFIKPVAEDDFYQRGQTWGQLSKAQRRKALTALIQYKSVYFMIGLSYLPPPALFAGLVVLAAYKPSTTPRHSLSATKGLRWRRTAARQRRDSCGVSSDVAHSPSWPRWQAPSLLGF
jgi:phosphatidylglycerophosphate synthase